VTTNYTNRTRSGDRRFVVVSRLDGGGRFLLRRTRDRERHEVSGVAAPANKIDLDTTRDVSVAIRNYDLHAC